MHSKPPKTKPIAKFCKIIPRQRPQNPFNFNLPQQFHLSEHDSITDHYNYGFNEETMPIYQNIIIKKIEAIRQSRQIERPTQQSQLSAFDDNIPMDLGGLSLPMHNPSMLVNITEIKSDEDLLRILVNHCAYGTKGFPASGYPLIDFLRLMKRDPIAEFVDLLSYNIQCSVNCDFDMLNLSVYQKEIQKIQRKNQKQEEEKEIKQKEEKEIKQKDQEKDHSDSTKHQEQEIKQEEKEYKKNRSNSKKQEKKSHKSKKSKSKSKSKSKHRRHKEHEKKHMKTKKVKKSSHKHKNRKHSKSKSRRKIKSKI